ncbi:ABC transporter ATP-binding protein [Boudabousia marimammalium]|uniref:ABC transporter domain-containing protein n=1 Tax=Boudabousia marimammalium TaxID=156892 RepID=A0A1Q5PJ86_9ACTO|nr:ABC transporter ATP-binding protein [Boudabousia marimammalium]OKL45905.1 hypothetical protein BM477_07825 [Boudabousia marimammalium]
MNGELLAFNSVTFGYRKNTPVLKGLSMSIEPGTLTCIVGKNGAGKSTLLSLAIGRFRPQSGQIRLDGLPPQRWQARSRVGYLPQGAGFPPMLTVHFILKMVANYKKTSIAQEPIIEEMGLLPYLDRRCGSLSGGWTRRLALCCALMGGPRLLILDEPTVGIDVACRIDVLNAITDFVANDGAVLWTTHIAEDAFSVDSDLLILQDGVCRNLGAFRAAADSEEVIIEVVSRQAIGPVGTFVPRRIGATWRYLVPVDQKEAVYAALVGRDLQPTVALPSAEELLAKALEEAE